MAFFGGKWVTLGYGWHCSEGSPWVRGASATSTSASLSSSAVSVAIVRLGVHRLKGVGLLLSSGDVPASVPSWNVWEEAKASGVVVSVA